MKSIIVSLLTLFIFGCGGGGGGDSEQASHPEPKIDVKSLMSTEPQQVIRDRLIDFVFGGPMPSDMPASQVVLDNTYSFVGFVEELTYGDAEKFRLYHAQAPNGKLIIYHCGHSQSFSPADRAIQEFLLAGYSVMAFIMPTRDHNQMAGLDHPLQSFAGPVIAGINYASLTFSEIHMTGLSGGGWTTMLVSALDSRIKKSYPVAGTFPKYLAENNPADYGDFEQIYLRDNFELLDLYALANDQTQIFNRWDACCFAGDAALGYVEAVRLKNPNFDVRVFDVGSHIVSQETIEFMLADLEN